VKLMRVLRVGCVGAVLAAAVAACNNVPTTPSGAPFSSTDLIVGTGATAAAGNTVTVNYTGWLYDATKTDGKGLVFDTTVGSDPRSFVLGNGSVIAGWDQGVPGMKIGGTRRLVIPSSLAYGASRNGPIPPNCTLVFDIELVNVQ
jgi:FKBP-type peptidyl-prolyl cis-trans isomerase FkpA